MNGWQSAFQSRFRPEFIQCDIGLFLQYVAHLGAVGFQNPGLASAEVSARANLSCMPTLLDELFTIPSETRNRRATCSRVSFSLS